MAGNNMKNILDKIEKLITEGQKELLAKFASVEGRLENVEGGLKKLEAKIDFVDQKHETNAKALYGLLLDTKNELNNKIDQVEDRLNSRIDQVESRLNNKIDQVEQKLGDKIDRVECKLDVHMKQPAHA